MTWYRGAPNQQVIIQEPGKPQRVIRFDSDGFYESDSRGDHVVLTGYASAEMYGKLDTGHGTTCVPGEPGSLTREAHKAAHEQDCNCVGESHLGSDCCGEQFVLHASSVRKTAALSAMEGMIARSEGDAEE